MLYGTEDSYFKHEYKNITGELKELSAKELENRISAIIARMPSRRREIFNMSRNEKLSNKEIAVKVGLSVRTIEKHIENALADIRKHLPGSILMLIMVLWK